MPIDYKKVVLDEYEKMKKNRTLAPNLVDPTPGDLRSECIIVCQERYSSKDDEILRLFFGEKGKEENYMKTIENSKAVKFKQLPRILKGEISNPGHRYIELIAWLINFNPRPSSSYYKVPTGQTPPYSPPTTGLKLPWKKIGITSFFLILAVVLGLTKYSSGDDETGTPSTKDTLQTTNPSTTLPTANSKNKSNETNSSPIEKKQCMYWADDHYEPVSCDKLLGDTAKVAIDEQKVALFKKITQPDTLTRNSLGRVWYVKIGGTIEYYTSEGFHPIQTDRKLKKLTDYMLNKYILSRRTFM